jgi:hypothetical protein
MKRIFLGLIAIALMAAPAFAGESGKKKAKKKAKIECKKDKCCDPKDCSKDAKCPPIPVCMGNK